MIIKSEDALEMLDPILGVVGKDGDVTFHSDGTTITVSVSDPARIAHITATLLIQSAEDEEILSQCERSATAVCVNITALISALKWLPGDVVISVTDSDVELASPAGKRTIRRQTEIDKQREPSVEYNLMFSVDGKHLRRIDTIDGIGESMQITVVPDSTMIVRSESVDESAEMYIGISINGLLKGPVMSHYSSEMLGSIVKRTHADDGIVHLSMGTRLPLRIETVNKCVHYCIWLAPRIMEEN
jgi:hypothetical protein